MKCSLTLDVPDAVVVLQKATANDIVVLVDIDEGLAKAGIILEWPDAEFARRNGEAECGARLRGEAEGNLGRKGGNLAACNAVRSADHEGLDF